MIWPIRELKGYTMFYKDERLALFIDGSNLYAAAKALGFDIDYKLLRQEFMRRGKLLRAFYYTALLENDEYSPIRPLVDWLHYNGFTMVTKPAKEYTDSQGRRKVKGNMDIELTVDAMELAPRVDHIVLFSGDGDFRSLVAAVQRKGVRVSVVSTITTQPPMVADELRRQADIFLAGRSFTPHDLGLYSEALFLTQIFTAKSRCAFRSRSSRARCAGNPARLTVSSRSAARS